MKNNVWLQLRVPEGFKKKVRRLADKNRRTMSDYVRVLIEELYEKETKR